MRTKEDSVAVLEDAIRDHVTDLRNSDSLDPLIERIGNARFVLLGEASHGTSEYYSWRARISKRLITEKGFRFIAVEGDWPDCYEVNRYVKGQMNPGMDAREVLHRFDRWPTWMWANWEVVALVEWMRRFNEGKSDAEKAGFYGLDVYSLWESLDAIYRYIRENHPDRAGEAIEAMACFEPFNREGQEYAWYTRMVAEDCEDEVVALLTSLRRSRAEAWESPESHFDAEQNALVAVNAERYYRAMVRSDSGSWNVRDVHMADTLDRLMARHGPNSKAIVWEHNTHIGDARATDMREAGMVNVGQLARERHASEGVVLVGFASYEGSVVAGSKWGAPMNVMPVPRAMAGSWEWILHRAIDGDGLLLLDSLRGSAEFASMRGHRAIGVVYHPEREVMGNYVPTELAQRYDALLFLNRTHALHPLHLDVRTAHEPPETYPWGV